MLYFVLVGGSATATGPLLSTVDEMSLTHVAVHCVSALDYHEPRASSSFLAIAPPPLFPATQLTMYACLVPALMITWGQLVPSLDGSGPGPGRAHVLGWRCGWGHVAVAVADGMGTPHAPPPRQLLSALQTPPSPPVRCRCTAIRWCWL